MSGVVPQTVAQTRTVLSGFETGLRIKSGAEVGKTIPKMRREQIAYLGHAKMHVVGGRNHYL
jgi:hypothetical protein